MNLQDSIFCRSIHTVSIFKRLGRCQDTGPNLYFRCVIFTGPNLYFRCVSSLLGPIFTSGVCHLYWTQSLLQVCVIFTGPNLYFRCVSSLLDPIFTSGVCVIFTGPNLYFRCVSSLLDPIFTSGVCVIFTGPNLSSAAPSMRDIPVGPGVPLDPLGHAQYRQCATRRDGLHYNIIQYR